MALDTDVHLYHGLSTSIAAPTTASPRLASPPCLTSPCPISRHSDAEGWVVDALQRAVTAAGPPGTAPCEGEAMVPMRFLCYNEAGGGLPPHVDLSRTRRDGRTSRCTFILYLTDCSSGGETVYLPTSLHSLHMLCYLSPSLSPWTLRLSLSSQSDRRCYCNGWPNRRVFTLLSPRAVAACYFSRTCAHISPGRWSPRACPSCCCEVRCCDSAQ